jgi:aryl-alcohol dehydrogenase-like predicted oxidoreductase
MIDTADMYSTWVPGHKGGESESIIGAWVAARRRRDDVLIATKVGMEIGGTKGLSPKRIASAVEDSLRRLRTDYIDLYFAHADDRNTPLEATLEAFDRLVRSGKVRAIGASNYDAPRLAEALDLSAARKVSTYSALQPLFNLMDRGAFEGPLQDLCLKRGVAVVPYFGLAAGFLTGKYRSEADLAGKPRAGMVKQHLNPRGFKVLSTLESVGAQMGARPGQVALAWLAAQPAVAAPIASATSVGQVEDLLGAMRLNLSNSQVAALDSASRLS